MTLLQRIRRWVLGKKLDALDPKTHETVALIAFLTWVQMVIIPIRVPDAPGVVIKPAAL